MTGKNKTYYFESKVTVLAQKWSNARKPIHWHYVIHKFVMLPVKTGWSQRFGNKEGTGKVKQSQCRCAMNVDVSHGLYPSLNMAIKKNRYDIHLRHSSSNDN